MTVKKLDSHGPFFIFFQQTILTNLDQKLYNRSIVRMITKAQEAGEIKNLTDAGQLVNLAVIIAIGVNIVWCQNNGKYDLKQELRHQMDILFGS